MMENLETKDVIENLETKDIKVNRETKCSGNFITEWGSCIKMATTVVAVLTSIWYAGVNESLEFVEKLLQVMQDNCPVLIFFAICYSVNKYQNHGHKEKMSENEILFSLIGCNIEDHENLKMTNETMKALIEATNQPNIIRTIRGMDGGTYDATTIVT